MGKEAIDQTLHALAGGVVTLIGIHFLMLPHTVAFLVMLAAAEVRELAQHDWNPKNQGSGSWLDLCCFAFGGGIALLVAGA